MSDKFVASNGMTVGIDQFGVGFFTSKPHGFMTLAEDEMRAMREFFRAERDEELGRWRWPEDADVVVRPSALVENRVLATSERTGQAEWSTRGEESNDWYGRAARAYFAAHPEPKPWGSAKNNEVWALRFSDQHGFLPYAVKTDEGGPRFWWTGNEGQSAGYFAREFAEGHRIFPEVSNVAE
ncbi:hypothetical protein [Leucobacter sp. NPDC077196]|uniref:hypothetical protein n=1 Tax=Leucobacter sp. NPDC077196 TaxID=3154959 RepID=UPI0034440F6A